MNRVILVLSDGLRYDTAVTCMGYLGHLVEARRATLYKVMGELPSMSRPIYETIHTGLPSSQHGIVSNAVAQPSTQPNIFAWAQKAGKITAAAAYSWFSELYNRVPYNRVDDKEVDDEMLAIQHGRFYTQEDYPDLEVFATAGMLVRKFSPHYLLVHPMGMDYHGEGYGADSREYRIHATLQDSILATLLPEWAQLGYHVLVSSDHGINQDRSHGGTTPEVREVPLYIIEPDMEGSGDTGQTVSQLCVAPTILKMLALPIPETMKHPHLR
jgi:predicted AlkP superfamily pyrophosphatase or phosphodiesterase